MATRTQYRLMTKPSAEAEREIHLIANDKGANWKPILMSTTATPAGVMVTIVFENTPLGSVTQTQSLV